MSKVYINKIIPFSSVDGPGNRTAIFLQGCNFNCLYCHNPETINKCINCGECVDVCGYGALRFVNDKVLWDKDKCQECDSCIKVCRFNSSPRVTLLTDEEVFKEVLKYKEFISGITVSGGECTLEIGFLKDLFKRIKEIGLTTFVDTNGSMDLDDELIELTDGFMVDLKSYDKEEHISLTGKDNEKVIENVKLLGKKGKLYEVRTVIVPGLLENKRNVENISKLISSLDPEIRYKLIKYRAHGVRKNLVNSNTPSDNEMFALKEIAENNGCRKVIIT